MYMYLLLCVCLFIVYKLQHVYNRSYTCTQLLHNLLLFIIPCLYVQNQLINLFLFVIFTVAKERRRRQAVESRLKHVEKVAEQLMSHYDGCFVELAKDVSLHRDPTNQMFSYCHMTNTQQRKLWSL